jgi:radical SAM superfamily enzyme YgiQ (UPF0313 family)
MKIGLIALSGVRVRTEELAELGVTLPQFVNRGRVIATLPSLGLLTVAALTPPDIEVVYREMNEVSADDPLEPFDLVGISSFTAMIDDAYALAERYRAAGIPVVLGGLHVSLMPDEAARHADSIVLYGAEGAWPRLVEDFRRGRLQPRYIGLRNGVFEPPHYASPRFDLLQGRPYNRITVQTSRGCPHDCEFCAASLRITSRFQQKPVDRVIAEIERAKAITETPFFELADDNTFVNAKWGKKFLRALAPLDVHWFTETDISVAEDEELLDLLAESGCRQVLIGLESPTARGLDRIDSRNWKQRHYARYLEAIERIQSRGVTVNGCFIVGLDNDTPEVFDQVRDFVAHSRLLEVQITVPTPFPGTPLYHRLQHQGRLLENRFWDRCTLFDVNFRPNRMTVEELESGLRWLFAEIYNETELRRRQRHYIDIVKQRREGQRADAPAAAPAATPAAGCA